MRAEHWTTIAFLLLAVLVGTHLFRHRALVADADDNTTAPIKDVPRGEVSDSVAQDCPPYTTPLYLRYNTSLSKTFYRMAGLPLLSRPRHYIQNNTI